MSIILLDENTVNKIAAGEVIERPRSVVKELVENSLDAGAAQVQIDIEQAGRKLIQVTDDGCGMSREDAVLSLQRHATSKIETAEDLVGIDSLGFRGEALPSIASVSKFRMITRRPEDASATQITAEGGVITDLTEVGAPPGTQVSVGRLFYNTPARLKFLKTEATELGQITDLVSKFALSHHGVDFRLTHNGREILRRPASSELLASVAALYGKPVAQQMIPLGLSLPSLRITGFISKPEVTRASKAHQTFFVNRRLIRSRSLHRALDDAYHGLLQVNRYPMTIVFIEIDPHLIDVNVHPTKSEVRFTREGEVYNAVKRAAKEALGAANLAPEAGVLRPARMKWERARQPVAMPTERAAATQTKPLLEMEGVPPAEAKPPAASAVPLGQLRRTYIIADAGDSFLLIDQHRAHERIIYERLAQADAASPVQSQGLAIPATIHLSHQEASVLEESRDTLRSLRFDLEPFGSDSFLVRSVPALLAKVDPEQLIRDLVDELLSLSPGDRVERRQEQITIMMACKSAIKAGDPLTPEEMERLIRELLATERPAICPHGQPVMMTISNSELDRKFQR